MGEIPNIVYEAMLYAFGTMLAKYGRLSRELLIRELGGSIRRYLAAQGINFEKCKTPRETVESVVRVFHELGFLESVEATWSDEDTIVTAIWKGLPGDKAYAALYRETSDPFLSCPLNAVVQEVLHDQNATLVVDAKAFQCGKGLIQSRERIVESPAADTELEQWKAETERLAIQLSALNIMFQQHLQEKFTCEESYQRLSESIRNLASTAGLADEQHSAIK